MRNAPRLSVAVFLFLLLGAWVLAPVMPPATAGGPQRVLVLPFKIHSEKDLTFLNRGIADMLTSRFGRSNQIEMVQPPAGYVPAGFTDQDSVLDLARKSRAAFVLYGTLTIFGDSASTDARLLEVATGKPVVAYNRTGEQSGAALGHVNELAVQITEELTGQRPEFAPRPPPETAPPLALQTPPPAAEPGTIWRIPAMEKEIRAMAVGDLDGDGSNEAVFINRNHLSVYRYQQQSLTPMARMEGKSYSHHLTVDVADINGNGRAEIFVSSLYKKHERLNSFVLEWDGNRLRHLAQGQPWYYRVLHRPGEVPLLVGQRRGLIERQDAFQMRDTGQLFIGPVHRLTWQGGGYEADQALDLPPGVNVFNFNYLHNEGAVHPVLVTLDFSDRLNLVEKNGSTQWTSPDPYGGNATFLEMPSGAGDDRQQTMVRYYLPQRILVVDTDADGRQEAVVVRNRDANRGLTSRFRRYKSGALEAFVWERATFRQHWKTDEMSGYISDYTLADLDGDGTGELLFTLVTPGKGVTGKDSSSLVAWRIR